MPFQGSSVAISHTGKIRSNNQDSGYAGSNLFVVADGMGGHAGGDVASSIAISHLRALDHSFESTVSAEIALQDTLLNAASDLVETVAQRPELTGMGTTVSALLMVDDYAVIAHIGDSRIYLYRDGNLTQITSDHTFVQRLVDSGRITPDEARVHPRRSVLMRVLGDMDLTPEIDTFIMPTQPGDRWLLCSDGLSGVVDDAYTRRILKQHLSPGRSADLLLKQALDGGAPDNVTLVLVEVGGSHALHSGTATVVGSASNPTGVWVPPVRSSRSGWLVSAKQAANEPTHFEPAASYLEELIEEDSRRSKRRRLAWIIGAVFVIAILTLSLLGAYNWTQTRYFVGAGEETVVIFQGIQQNIGPISLSSEYADTGISLYDLPPIDQSRVAETISASSLAEAEQIVQRLRDVVAERALR